MKIKKFFLILLFIPVFSLAGDIRNYEYKVEGLRSNVEKSGTIKIKKITKGNKEYELAVVNVKADWGKDNFSTEDEMHRGLVIYDIKNNKQPQGYSIFAPYINLKNYPVGYSTKLIVLNDSRQPHFGDPSWVFKFEIMRNEELLINQKKYNSIYSILKGIRSTGFSQNCPIKTGNVGEITVETWHSSEDSSIIKQVFQKYGCFPTRNKLTRATWTIKD